ncbi:MAG: hypothetical protein ACI9UH_000169 [Gammaproteobacteria bacterium]|jgi:hypothetical protein
MAELLINTVKKTLIVQDALKKPELDKDKKKSIKKNKPDKKDPKRIIDTYV